MGVAVSMLHIGHDGSLCAGLLGANLLLAVLMTVLTARFPGLTHEADATGM